MNEQNKNVKKFVDLKTDIGNAIEFGCGAGRDTIYLIRNNWNVLAIDREDVENRIKGRLTQDEQRKFRFQRQNFEEIVLEKNNFLVANFFLPFCKKECFYELWKKIENSILPNRLFCW